MVPEQDVTIAKLAALRRAWSAAVAPIWQDADPKVRQLFVSAVGLDLVVAEAERARRAELRRFAGPIEALAFEVRDLVEFYTDRVGAGRRLELLDAVMKTASEMRRATSGESPARFARRAAR